MTQLSPISLGGIDYYDKTPQAYLTSQAGRRATASAVSLAAALEPGSLIVDAGCGAGVETAFFCKSGHDVYAYDASQEMVKAAQSVVTERCPVIHLHGHHDLKLQRPAQAIYAGASLLFLDDKDLASALQVLASNLAPGGVLVTFFKQGSGARTSDDGRVFHDKEPQDLESMAAMCGLTPLSAYAESDMLGRSQAWVTFWFRKPK